MKKLTPKQLAIRILQIDLEILTVWQERWTFTELEHVFGGKISERRLQEIERQVDLFNKRIFNLLEKSKGKKCK